MTEKKVAANRVMDALSGSEGLETTFAHIKARDVADWLKQFDAPMMHVDELAQVMAECVVKLPDEFGEAGDLSDANTFLDMASSDFFKLARLVAFSFLAKASI